MTVYKANPLNKAQVVSPPEVKTSAAAQASTPAPKNDFFVVVTPSVEKPFCSGVNCPSWAKQIQVTDPFVREARELAKMARLDRSHPLANRWIQDVHASKVETGPKPIVTLRQIVAGFEKWGIRYLGEVPNDPSAYRWLALNMQRPLDMLVRRSGSCRASSVLVAATLEALGFKAVLISNTGHQISGILLPDSETDPELEPWTVSLSVNDERLFRFIPIEADFLEKEYDFDSAMRHGRNFMKELFSYRGEVVIIDTEGRVLIQKKIDQETLLGPVEPVQDLPLAPPAIQGW